MQNNRALWKAIHGLTHPLTIFSILLLLFNDHWLRHTYPSWLTGKLGDFTWLLFAPFITAIFLALIIPAKTKRQAIYVGTLAIGFIGIWFATAKTIPAVHGLTTETLYAMLGYRGSLRMDVTDLLTLPALLISGIIWWQASDQSIRVKPIGYALFGLAMLGTMASDDPIYNNTAIETVCISNSGQLTTSYKFQDYYYDPEANPDKSFVSPNGGLTWVEDSDLPESDTCSAPNIFTAQHPTDDNIVYRWEKDAYVERSNDGGETWQRIHELRELDQDVRDYGNQNPYHDFYQFEPEYKPSPVSGIVHPETGNLILAMSRDGVLVITPDNQSEWVSVGIYQLDNLQDIALIDSALSAHYFLLPTLWALILVSTVVLIQGKKIITRSFLVIGWMHWAILVVTSHKVFTILGDSYDVPDSAFFWGLSALFSAAFIAFPMVVWASLNLFHKYLKAIVPVLITTLLASIAYMLPLAFWMQGTIARYYIAGLFALFLVGCVLASCYVQFKDRLPDAYVDVKPKRKGKPKVDDYPSASEV